MANCVRTWQGEAERIVVVWVSLQLRLLGRNKVRGMITVTKQSGLLLATVSKYSLKRVRLLKRKSFKMR